MYSPLPTQVDLPAFERETLARWNDSRVFARSLEKTADGPRWTFYEGPPTANGRPGTHHVEARAFKDVFPRFKTMKGYHVPRKAGWDCHGLPVELAVERQLGFSGKGDIETYGIAKFNAACRESVERYVGAFEEMTERMGYWVDMSTAYRTMDPEYVDAVWHSLKGIHARGLLVEDHRVAPYCPRCGTTLSDAEVAQGYLTVTDPSVFVRFPLTSGPLAGEADLLVWTTTPWTLVSNVAVAVHPDVTYVVATDGKSRLVVAEPLVDKALGEGWQVERSMAGRELERWSYTRPFDLVEAPGAHFVTLAEYVTTEDGTGLVHIAPAFGADDLAVGREYGLPVVNPVQPDGHFDPAVGTVGGMFFKKADPTLIEDLRTRGILVREQSYEHAYPHCWRCDTPLLYYALPSWYIRTTRLKDRMIAENDTITWYPPHIKHGRFGDWLENNIDWALSRSRYWGTPLPVWRCDAGHITVVGSRAELGELAGRDLSDLDPHRPYVDEVTVTCGECQATARRVPEVLDAWYDSGAMPFAQWGAPLRNEEAFQEAFPADFIAEAIDQTRGWFYTLLAVGTLAFDQTSYKTVLCLGHILDAEGRKMSTRLGNVLDPMMLMDRHGADALRWFMLCSGSPWTARRVSHEALDEVVRRVLLTYWNTASFQVLYARAAGWSPDAPSADPGERSDLDRWVLSELHRTVAETDAALEAFDTARAGRVLGAFVDDLSNWYVRRSRRRFWAGDPDALATLHECLDVLTRLMAPFAPFLTDYVWQHLMTGQGSAGQGSAVVDSVHLAAWPVAREDLIDPGLGEAMALLRRLVELGRSARAESGVKTRQPLGRALISAPGWEELGAGLRTQLAEELNVSDLAPLADAGDLVDIAVKPQFRSLGKRFGKQTPRVADALTQADPTALVAALRERKAAPVTVDGDVLEIGPDDVLVTETPRSGWAVASADGETVALDLEITPALRYAGLARDVVRLVQEARKSADLDVSDRIEFWWQADDPSSDIATAMREHRESVAGEVLAVEYEEGHPEAPVAPHRSTDLGLTFWLRMAGG